MWKPRLSRIGALFFAVIIAAGGSGLPVLDAAFHHLSDAAGSSQIVNPAAAQSHDAVCTLGVPLPVAAASSAITGGARFVAPVTCPVVPLHAVPRPNVPPLLRLPRAPPALLA